MLPRILSGRYKISHENVLALSRMSPQEVKKFGRQMKATRQSSTTVPYVVSRTQLGQITPEPPATLQTGIKNMPDYDPDAEITGLTLTIPSWTNSINRTRNNSILKTVSIKARMNLQHVLDKALRILVSTWEGEMYSLSGNTLNAVARLIAAYGDTLNEETFKDRLGLIPMKTIIRTARERRPGSLGYAEAMLVFYNKKCKYRLSMKKLYGLNTDEDDLEDDDDSFGDE